MEFLKFAIDIALGAECIISGERGSFMKINEVCKKSKLSEKAVRYYTENGITSPVVTERAKKGKREFLFVTIFCVFLSALFVLSFKPDGLLCCGTIIVMYIALTKRPNNKTSIAIALCFLIFAGIFIYAIPSRVEAYTKVPATRYYIDSNGEYRPDFDAEIGDENISSLLEPTTDKERLQEMYKEGYEKYIKAKKEHHKNKPFILIGIIIHIINTVNMIITSVMLIFSKELNEYLQYRKSKKLPN